MLRAERSRFSAEFGLRGSPVPSAREVLLAVAPPPKTPSSYSIAGWPSWLVPAYRYGAHRPVVRLLEEKR